MAKSQCTDEQIIEFLKQAEGDILVKELCRLGDLLQRRSKFGSMHARGATRLRPISERQPLAASPHVNDTWSTDFVRDALANGRPIMCLTVIADFSRECVDIAMDHGMGGEYVLQLLDQAAQFRGYLRAIRTDHGLEFTSRAFIAWMATRGVRHLLPDAGLSNAERLHRELQRHIPRRVFK